MSNTKQIKRTCIKGHTYYTSSDCMVCPVCAQDEQPESGLLSKVNAPVRRALLRNKVTDVEALAAYGEKEILAWHGVGPSSIPLLKKALADKGLQFNPLK